MSLIDQSESNLLLYKSAILTLCKFMCISPKFCEEHIMFLFELLGKDINPSLKLNVVAGFGDLINRYPNFLSKFINKFFNCLQDKDTQVRRYSMTVISHLVLNDMLRIKGEIVDICMLLDTEDTKLKDLVNLFLYELNLKGKNTFYNIIPNALVRFSNEFKEIEYEKIKEIMKTLLNFISKDKQMEGLTEKLFSKLKISHDKIEWRNTTFCLSQLNYSDKNYEKFENLFYNLKEIPEDDKINENLNIILNKLKRIITNEKIIVENGNKRKIEKNKLSKMKNNSKTRNYIEEEVEHKINLSKTEEQTTHNQRFLRKRNNSNRICDGFKKI